MIITVGDVMTRCPVSVLVDMPFETVAAVLTRHGISAVPVVDRGGLLVGVVSEADLIGTPRNAFAGDLMTTALHTVAEDAPLPSAARTLVDAGVRRLFVTAHGRLVGVVSRRDLLKTYVVDDETIRERVQRALVPVLPDQRAPIRVTVRDGVVLLLGRVEWRSSRVAVDARVHAVPGVVDVLDRLDYVFDDRPRGRFARSGR